MLAFRKIFTHSSSQEDKRPNSTVFSASEEKKFIELINALSSGDFKTIDDIVPQDEHSSRAFTTSFESYLERSLDTLPVQVQESIDSQVTTAEFIKRMILHHSPKY